ncbi:LysR family transcriptional regulator [Lacrimispora sp.]|uniref:LysR family transcriptional regulator n=1 Tax=Lacrimispora sp. TaxID=2719234 RepID=UPI003993B266
MELKRLHTFLVLSKLKNFTKTAEYLHYAQSNVTTQIQQLESELGVKLFERLGKNISLTPEGEEFIAYANQILYLTDDLKHKFANKNDHGRITIGASESICIYRLPEIIKAYQTKHPNVELYLNVLDSTDFIPLLVNNEIDISFTLDLPIYNSSINTALMIDETICAFSIPEHPLAQKAEVTIEDFLNIPLILTGQNCCYRKMFEKDLLNASITPKIVLETSSLQVIKQTVLSGLGICVLPQLSVQKELDNNELVKLNYATNYKLASQVIYHKNKWISQNLKDFIDTVRAKTLVHN